MSRAQPSGIAALLHDYRSFAGPRLWLALALMLASAAAEGFGLLMIVPIATIALGDSDSPLAHLMAWPQSWSEGRRLALALALFVSAMALRSLLIFLRTVLLSSLRNEYEADLRLRAATTLARRGWPFAARIGQSAMQSLLLNDVPRAGEAASYLQEIAVAAAMLLVQLLLTFILSPSLTLVALLFLFAGSLVSTRFARTGVRSGLAIVTAMETSAASGFRFHSGLKAALAQGTVGAFLAEYRSSLAHTARRVTHYARDYGLMQQGAAFGAAVVAAVLLFVGVRLLALPFPVLVTSLVLFARMTAPAQQLQNSVVGASAYAPAFATIEQRLGPLADAIPAEEPRMPLDWTELKVESVAYEHQPGLGLKHATLTLKAGEWLGIEGPSGSGKTTLMDVIAGLLPASSGRISVDARPLDTAMLERWRAGIAYVGQEGSVFNDSVRANLLAERVCADEQQLWEVLELVDLAERVRAFGQGLDENVGDRGSQLSGGERQRLVLARGLLRKPELLILDEATAALDPDSESDLLRRIKALDPPAALIAAHRQSTLSHCDSVLSIQHGVLKAPEQRNSG